MSDLVERLRGKYRIKITDGLGPAGGEEPDNPNEFVTTYPSTPIQREAANEIERLTAALAAADKRGFEKAKELAYGIATKRATFEAKNRDEIHDHCESWYFSNHAAFIASDIAARILAMKPQ